jgi:hypothetical protein
MPRWWRTRGWRKQASQKPVSASLLSDDVIRHNFICYWFIVIQLLSYVLSHMAIGLLVILFSCNLTTLRYIVADCNSTNLA